MQSWLHRRHRQTWYTHACLKRCITSRSVAVPKTHATQRGFCALASLNLSLYAVMASQRGTDTAGTHACLECCITPTVFAFQNTTQQSSSALTILDLSSHEVMALQTGTDRPGACWSGCSTRLPSYAFSTAYPVQGVLAAASKLNSTRQSVIIYCAYDVLLSLVCNTKPMLPDPSNTSCRLPLGKSQQAVDSKTCHSI